MLKMKVNYIQLYHHIREPRIQHVLYMPVYFSFVSNSVESIEERVVQQLEERFELFSEFSFAFPVEYSELSKVSTEHTFSYSGGSHQNSKIIGELLAIYLDMC